MEKKIKVMWLKPAKGKVSIGRWLISETLKEKGFDVDTVECSGLEILRKFSEQLKSDLKSDYSIVIGTTHFGLAIGGLTKILFKKKFIADFVDDYETIFNTIPRFLYPITFTFILLEKLALKVADTVIVIPHENYQEISKFKKDVFKTNLCINLEKFISSDNTLRDYAIELIERNGVDLNKPLVIYVGGFNEIYNLDLLVESMRFLPDIQLVMIGGGKLENKLKDLKEGLNLKNVYFLGYLPNEVIAEVMKLCDVGVTLCGVPRQLKIYEYLASGLKVVVSESVLSSEDFEFAEYCIGVNLDAKDVAEKIKIALKVSRKRNRNKKLMKLLEKYSCRRIAEVYARVIRTLS
jgi:glycosyltransferase involved in cell wall biosynthesis